MEEPDPYIPPRSPNFPSHTGPRIWLLTSADSPLGISLTRHLLQHGDHVTAGVCALDFETHDARSADFRAFLHEVRGNEAWQSRLRVVALDIRVMAQCQSAVADTLAVAGRIDVLFVCTSESVVGSVEELAASRRTQALVRQQFESTFFGPVNVIKAVLPSFRARRNGHIIVLSAITGHLGTPGLGFYCASQWALEGYCDSLAYEVAPFNVRTLSLIHI